MLEIERLEYLYSIGVVTLASIERAKIINDFVKMKPKFRRTEMLYYKLSDKHFKSFYTIRNIILTYQRNEKPCH